MRRAALVSALLALAACKAEAPRQHPALWEVRGPGGAQGYVFGTVHALPAGLDWRSTAIDAAIAKSDTLVLEIVDPSDEGAARQSFGRLGTTPGQPPLAARVRPELRDELNAALARTRLQPGQFHDQEDWAAALTLSFALEAQNGFDPNNGADRALLAAAGKRKVEGLETLDGQLGLFDALSPREQRRLLEAVVAESADDRADDRLIEAWATGDVSSLDREGHEGMMADPRLREALLAGRNRRWAQQVAAMLKAGRKPFVAVGAAHVAGVDGLPALLGAAGYEVRRVQ